MIGDIGIRCVVSIGDAIWLFAVVAGVVVWLSVW